MLKLSDHAAIVHCPSILLVQFSVLSGHLQPRYKRFCWCAPSFFIDFPIIHKEPINIHTIKITDYLLDNIGMEHCPSNHLIPIIAL